MVVLAEKITREPMVGDYIDLVSYVKESARRSESVEVYMVNRNTGDVISAPLNPPFIAGILKTGMLTNYKITGMTAR